LWKASAPEEFGVLLQEHIESFTMIDSILCKDSNTVANFNKETVREVINEYMFA